MASDVPATSTSPFDCVACGAHGTWHPGRQAVVCPACGTALDDAGRRTGGAGARSSSSACCGIGRTADATGSPARRACAAPPAGRRWTTRRTSPARLRGLRLAGPGPLRRNRCARAPVRHRAVPAHRAGGPRARRRLAREAAADRVATDASRSTRCARSTCRAGPSAPARACRGAPSGCGRTARAKPSGSRSTAWSRSRSTTTSCRATASVPADLLAQADPFDAADLVAYDPRYLAGYEVEVYAVNLWDAWDAVRRADAAPRRQRRARRRRARRGRARDLARMERPALPPCAGPGLRGDLHLRRPAVRRARQRASRLGQGADAAATRSACLISSVVLLGILGGARRCW